MKLAAQEQMIPGADLIEKWEFVSALGFSGIEVRGKGDLGFAERLPELKAAKAAGVAMPTVCPEMSHFVGNFDAALRRDAIDNMKSMLSVMGEIGGMAAMTPASWGMFSRRLPPFEPPRTPERDTEVLVETFTELGGHAQREGVKILLEPLNRYEDHMINTLGQAIEICKATGLDSVGVVGDIFHMNIEEDNPREALRQALPYVHHLQIGDSNRLEPGTGHLDFADLFSPLIETDWDGYLAMECRFRASQSEALTATALIFNPLCAQTSQ